MSDDMLYTLLAKVPAGAGSAIVIYPDGDGFRCAWMGLDAEDVARTLYAMGDRVVDEKIPAKPWKPPA